MTCGASSAYWWASLPWWQSYLLILGIVVVGTFIVAWADAVLTYLTGRRS